MDKKRINITYNTNRLDALEVNHVVIEQHWLDASKIVINDEMYLLDIEHPFTNTMINLTNLVSYVICSFTKETGFIEGITVSKNEDRAPYYFQTQAKLLLILPLATNVDLANIRNLVL